MINNKTRDLIRIALFASLTAVLSQISIPLPFTPVPVNLATFSMLLSGALLGWKNAGLSQLIYIFLGGVGVPVFAGFSSGLGIIIGPTGGYILGYTLGAMVIGLVLEKMSNKIFAFSLGTLVCYIVGTMWFMVSTNTGLLSSLTLCVLPFLPGDILKIIAGNFVVKRLRNIC